MIYGIGHRSYLAFFEQKQICENDKLALITEELEFYVNSDGSLDWADVHTKRVLAERKQIHNIENILPEEVLSRKRWYIK